MVKVIVIRSSPSISIPRLRPTAMTAIACWLAYPESVREYFHGALEGEQPGQGGVHVVQHELVRVRLVVVLDTHQVRVKW